ncbi:MAG: hypothetical protein QM780_07580 [Hyphomicrobium sp.]|uniref:hypothetical protein n=1 Tax=Hyphomicrobium sp. TaxID=82 RepID=UPI0039E67B07
MTANAFAYFALAAWPFVGLWLFSRLPLTQAILWTILGGYLLLPVGVSLKIEGVPAFDKESIPNLTALLGSILVTRRLPRFRTGYLIADLALLAFLVGPFITSELNGDMIVVGKTFLPGVGHYDALSAAVGQFLFIIPFFLGLQFLRSARDTREILRVLVIGGLFYSIPMLFEIRMSPQLQGWIYGTSGSGFLQQIREGGFRPVVFLGHGLLVAFFAMTAFVASVVFLRTRERALWLLPAGVTASYLGVLLILCKTLGALIFATALAPAVFFLKPRVQILIATVFAAIALLYPTLRAADMVPTNEMVDLANSYSPERAESLGFRFNQEQQLLVRARERFFFGWGRFGRNRIYDEYSGKDLSVTDGRWIITMGQFGFIGFLAEFGLLAYPIFRALSTLRFAEIPNGRLYLAAIALILAANILDLIPNSSIRPWTWLLAGTLLGRGEVLNLTKRQQATIHVNSW